MEERFQALEASLNNNQIALRSTQLNDTFAQIMDRLDAMDLDDLVERALEPQGSGSEGEGQE